MVQPQLSQVLFKEYLAVRGKRFKLENWLLSLQNRVGKKGDIHPADCQRAIVDLIDKANSLVPRIEFEKVKGSKARLTAESYEALLNILDEQQGGILPTVLNIGSRGLAQLDQLVNYPVFKPGENMEGQPTGHAVRCQVSDQPGIYREVAGALTIALANSGRTGFYDRLVSKADYYAPERFPKIFGKKIDLEHMVISVQGKSGVVGELQFGVKACHNMTKVQMLQDTPLSLPHGQKRRQKSVSSGSAGLRSLDVIIDMLCEAFDRMLGPRREVPDAVMRWTGQNKKAADR